MILIRGAKTGSRARARCISFVFGDESDGWRVGWFGRRHSFWRPLQELCGCSGRVAEPKSKEIAPQPLPQRRFGAPNEGDLLRFRQAASRDLRAALPWLVPTIVAGVPTIGLALIQHTPITQLELFLECFILASVPAATAIGTLPGAVAPLLTAVFAVAVVPDVVRGIQLIRRSPAA